MNIIQRNASAFARAILDDVKEIRGSMSTQGRTGEITVDDVYALQLAEAEHFDLDAIAEMEATQQQHNLNYPSLNAYLANRRAWERRWRLRWMRIARELQRQLSESRTDHYDALTSMVRQTCGIGDGTYQHFYLSTFVSAFETLAAAGIMRQVNQVNWVFVADAKHAK